MTGALGALLAVSQGAEGSTARSVMRTKRSPRRAKNSIVLERLRNAAVPVPNRQSQGICASDWSTNSQGWTKSTTGARMSPRSRLRTAGGALRTDDVVEAGIRRMVLRAGVRNQCAGLYRPRDASTVNP